MADISDETIQKLIEAIDTSKKVERHDEAIRNLVGWQKSQNDSLLRLDSKFDAFKEDFDEKFTSVKDDLGKKMQEINEKLGNRMNNMLEKALFLVIGGVIAKLLSMAFR